MFANERQNIILKEIKQKGAATTAAISKKLGVSIETVRKDFVALEKKGLLVRVHGGALGTNENAPDLDYERRTEFHKKEKTELSYAAATLVEEGDVIAVDSGSTAAEFIEVLKENFSRLTIVTASTDIFDSAKNYKDFKIFLCGGEYLRGENSFYGAFAVETMKKFHVKKSFIFPSAVSISGGIEIYKKEFYELQNTLISIADEVVIMADSSKFEKRAFIKTCDISSAKIIVTDSALGEEIKEIYKTNGIKLVTGGNTNE